MTGTQGTKDTAYLAVSVSIVTFLVYLSSLGNNFVLWDDDLYILENQHIVSLNPAFLRWAFASFYLGIWHPLTWISHAVDFSIWGLNPLGHHLTSVIVHCANTFIVVVLSIRLMEKYRGEKASEFLEGKGTLIAAVLTGLLFGIHPLHVESVAWISERKDVLCALFFLSGILSYTRYLKDRCDAFKPAVRSFFSKWYLVTLIFFVLALLSKPMAVSFPLVLLIADWFPFKRVRSAGALMNVFIEKMPFIVLSLVSSAVAFTSQKSGNSIMSLRDVPLNARVLVGFKSLLSYLLKMIAPVNLNPFYPYPKSPSISSPEYIVPVIVVTLITGAVFFWIRHHKLFASVWLYYLVTLVPVLGLVQIGEQAMADRYTYLPAIGLFLMAGIGAAWGWKKLEGIDDRSFLFRSLGLCAVFLLLSALAFASVRQIAVWKNTLSLWSCAIERSSQKTAQAYNNRGLAFSGMGQIDRSIQDFKNAIDADPSYFKAYDNLGVAYGKTKRFTEAMQAFDKSISLKPNNPVTYYNRGFAFHLIHDDESALRDFTKAIDLNSEYSNAYFNRGSLYLAKKNNELALLDFKKACALGHAQACRLLRIQDF